MRISHTIGVSLFSSSKVFALLKSSYPFNIDHLGFGLGSLFPHQNLFDGSSFNITSYYNTKSANVLRQAYLRAKQVALTPLPCKSSLITEPFFNMDLPVSKPTYTREQEIYNCLKVGLHLTPAEYIKSYNYYFNNRQYTKCFEILEIIFECGSDKHLLLKKYLLYQNICPIESHQKVNKIVYFDCENISNNFTIDRCHQKNRHSLNAGLAFYLPQNVLNLESFMEISLELQNFIIYQLHKFELINGELYEHYKNEAILIQTLAKTLEITQEVIIVRLLRFKFFAFHLIAMCKTDDGQNISAYKSILTLILQKEQITFFKALAIGLGLIPRC